MIETGSATDLRAHVANLRARGGRIAFVPTMGNLHDGHRRLMEVARKYADAVVASIYVNPLQFGPREDFASYPRTPDADREMLKDVGVDLLFLPAERDVYPRGREAHTVVEVPKLSDVLCGVHRPGHFRGVTTVVARLFGLVTPDIALFGKKDYQQLLSIRLMVEDLVLPIEIVGVDTVREPDGLAMSSRNSYLNAQERKTAVGLYGALRQVCEDVQRGTSTVQAEQTALSTLRGLGFKPDYVSVRRQADLAEPEVGDTALVVLAAAFLGSTRLIDNLEFARLKPHG